MTYEMHSRQKLYSKCPETDWTNESEEYVLCGPLPFLEEGSPSVEMQPTENEKQFAEGFLARFDKELDNAVENIKRENTQKNQESNDIDNYL